VCSSLLPEWLSGRSINGLEWRSLLWFCRAPKRNFSRLCFSLRTWFECCLALPMKFLIRKRQRMQVVEVVRTFLEFCLTNWLTIRPLDTWLSIAWEWG
jgi:hypothetical protein